MPIRFRQVTFWRQTKQSNSRSHKWTNLLCMNVCNPCITKCPSWSTHKQTDDDATDWWLQQYSPFNWQCLCQTCKLSLVRLISMSDLQAVIITSRVTVLDRHGENATAVVASVNSGIKLLCRQWQDPVSSHAGTASYPWCQMVWQGIQRSSQWENETTRLLLLTDVIHYLVTSVAYRRTHLLRRHCNCQ